MTAALDGLTARFSGRLGTFQLNAALALPAEGVTALVGPSGSGKTTLLRCIAGLTRLPGTLTVAGEVWQDDRTLRPTHRRAVGFVFQEASLLAHLSVRGNLAYAESRAGPGEGVRRDEMIHLLGLEGLLDRAPGRLSGGERQRVALGRALLSRPRILLLDEPLSNLDEAGKADILPYLQRLHRALAIPALYVSHDRAEVRRLADRVLEMSAGQVREAAVETSSDHRLLAGLSEAQRDDLALAALKAGLGPANPPRL